MKTKFNFKILLALAIVLMAMYVFNMNTVNATVDQTVLDNVQDSITINLEDFKQGEDKIISVVKGYLPTLETGYKYDIKALSYNGNIKVGVAVVSLKDNEYITYKEIDITINKVSTYNSNDKNYVDNVLVKTCTKDENGKEYNITTTKYRELNKSNYNYDLNQYFNIKEFKKIVNDSNIQIIEQGGYGDGGWIFRVDTEKCYDIFKDGVKYSTVNWKVILDYVITVPSTIEETESAYIKYATPKINEFINWYNTNADDETVTLEKIEKARGNEYKITFKEGGYDYITIKKDTTTNTPTTDNKTETTTNTTVIDKTDTTTNVKLNAPIGTVPNNTLLKVETVKQGTIYNSVKSVLTNVKDFVVFDITLLSNGTKIQPNGNVQISIPIPTEFDKSNLVVYRIADDGTKTEYAVTVKDNYATFETNHFSNYALAEKAPDTTPTTKPTTTPTTTNKKEKDPTPKTGTVDIIGYVLVITTVAGIGIIALKKNIK